MTGTDILRFAELRQEPVPLNEPDGFELPPVPRFEHPTLKCPAAWIVGDVGRMLMEDPPPVRWLVEGLLPAGVPGILAARAGAGKSMTALSIGMCLAAGLSVLGRPVCPEEARGVLFVGLEDDEDEFHRRVRRGLALLEEQPEWTPENREALTSRLVPLFPNRGSGLAFSLEAQWQTLVEHAKAIPGGCGLIVLDTLSRMADGDENSASDMRPFNESVSALAAATGGTVLSIHHLGKGNDGNSEKKLWQRLHPEALRGSSSVEAAARFIVQMAALSPSEAETAGLEVDQALRGVYVALNLSKMSAAEKGATVLLERRQSQEPGAGFLCLHPDSEQILAIIQGEAAVLKLTKQDMVLLAIAEHGGLEGLDKKAAASLIWPESPKPVGQWDKLLVALREKKYLTGPKITEAGWAKAATLGHGPSARKPTADPTPAGGFKNKGLPHGRGEAEEPEGNSSFPSTTLGPWNGRKGPNAPETDQPPLLPAAPGDDFEVDL
jgi:hypothetical protein